MADYDFTNGDVFLVRTREQMIEDNLPKIFADGFAIGYLSYMMENGITPESFRGMIKNE